MIKNSEQIKTRLKENIEQQWKMVAQAVVENNHGRTMFHTGHVRGLQNALDIIEMFEKEVK